MKGFSGFPQKGRLTKIPGLFFSELLPQIDSLAELKVTLYCFWRLQRKEGWVGYLRHREILSDQIFMSGLGAREDERRTALLDALERAVARGTLLHVQVHHKGRDEDLYFVNTSRGRAVVKSIEQGKWEPGDDDQTLLDLSVERPNIFTLYEQNIGPLTPLIADRLRDVEQTYPEEWIDEAIEIAVGRNRRNIGYVEGILRRWRTEGRAADGTQTNDGWRYVSGKYGDEIDH
jgi:DNA replication protein